MEYMKDTKLSKRYYSNRRYINKELVERGVFLSDFMLDTYTELSLLWEEGVFDN